MRQERWAGRKQVALMSGGGSASPERDCDFLRAADAAHAGQDVRDCVGVALSRTRGHGVVRKDLFEGTLVGIAGRAFNAELSGNSAKNDRCEAAATKLQLEICAVEGSPLAFENDDIVWPA